jgi:hypothetical protein
VVGQTGSGCARGGWSGTYFSRLRTKEETRELGAEELMMLLIRKKMQSFS